MTVAPANTSSIIVAVTGVLQDPSTYSVSGTTLTFSAAPPSGTSNISVRYLGIPASGVTTTAYRTVTNFTATAAQTSFSVPSYTVGYIDVYRNGVRLVSTDFTATTGTTVVLVNACTSGDSVVTESFYVSSVINAVAQTNGSSTSQTLVSPTMTSPALGTPASGVMTNVTSVPAAQLTGSQAIPKATLPTGSVLQVVQGSYGSAVSSSSSTFADTGLTASITPLFSTSKILAIVALMGVGKETNNTASQTNLVRGSTVLLGSTLTGFTGTTAANRGQSVSYCFLDSPATTSSTTYKVQIASWNNNAVAYLNDFTGSPTPLSTITLMEIAA
jgi:hypothetical protein